MNDMTLRPVAHFPLAELQTMAAAIAKSGLFGMKTPEQALALMLISQAEGVHPATITQDYDIIQGRASRKTNSVLARFQAVGGHVEWHELSAVKADATFTPPKGAGKPLRMEWTIEMAKAAKLVGKDNWTGYPRAMLRARCIAEGVRAVYPAAIGGMLVSEEAQDIVEKDVTPMGSHSHVEPTKAEPAEAPEKPLYSDESFVTNIPKWRSLIEAGKKTADEIIATVESKATLTEAQTDAIRGWDALASKEDIDALVEEAEKATITRAELWQALNVDFANTPITIGVLMRGAAFIANPGGAR